MNPVEILTRKICWFGMTSPEQKQAQQIIARNEAMLVNTQVDA
jgi:hypothetical protein